MKKVFCFFVALCFTSGALAANVFTQIERAQSVLNQSKMSAGCGVKSIPCRTEKDFDKANVLVAVSCGGSLSFKPVRLLFNKESSGVYEFRRGATNGVNTTFVVTKPSACVVLAQKRAIRQQKGKFREVVYTAYSPGIDTPEMRTRGMSYLTHVIDDAREKLRAKKVISRAFHRRLVADTVPTWVAVRLALIEHIDPFRIKDDSVEQLMHEVQVVLAANGANAYRYSISDKKARGIFQIPPDTYGLMLRDYSTALLKKDFAAGIKDPVDAAEVTLLLFDRDTETLSTTSRKILRADPMAQMEYLAAAYNSGSGPAKKALLSDGTLVVQNLPSETQEYIFKLRGVHDTLRLDM